MSEKVMKPIGNVIGPPGPEGPMGISVADIAQTAVSVESGGVNALTVTLSDNRKFTFNYRNGDKGDAGEAFRVVRTYASVSAMNADFANAEVPAGGFVVIASDTEDPDNAKLYVKGESAFIFITDLSGARGIQGPSGSDGVGIASLTHTTDANGNIAVTITLSNGATSSFTVPKGEKGDTGTKGDKGDTGATGPQGPKGDKGDTGETGTFSVADLQRITDLETQNAIMRELIMGNSSDMRRTASGAPAVFEDGKTANLEALRVTITPTQNGTPTPENPVPISGVSSVSVTRTGVNILPPRGGSEAGNGLTWVANNDGTLTVTGTVQNTSWYSNYFTVPISELGLKSGDTIYAAVKKLSGDNPFGFAVHAYPESGPEIGRVLYVNNENSAPYCRTGRHPGKHVEI